MLCFVTGATGFIGGRLVDALVDQGHKVRVLVRRPEGSPELHQAGVELVRGDLGDRASPAGTVGDRQHFACTIAGVRKITMKDAVVDQHC